MNTRPLAILSALAIAISLSAPVIAEETLGRLFFTPERRQALDHQREFNIQEKVETQQEPTFTINGVVTRSSGKRTVWINGEAQHDNDSTGTVRAFPEARHPERVRIQPDDAPTVRAAVGDTVLRDTGETAPLLGDGQIRIHRAPTGVR